MASCNLSMGHRQKTLVGGCFVFCFVFSTFPPVLAAAAFGDSSCYRLARLGVELDPTLPSAPWFLTWRVYREARLLPAMPPRAVWDHSHLQGFLLAAPGCHECCLSTGLQPVARHFPLASRICLVGRADGCRRLDFPSKGTEQRGEVFTAGFCRSLAELRLSLLLFLWFSLLLS